MTSVELPGRSAGNRDGGLLLFTPSHYLATVVLTCVSKTQSMNGITGSVFELRTRDSSITTEQKNICPYTLRFILAEMGVAGGFMASIFRGSRAMEDKWIEPWTDYEG